MEHCPTCVFFHLHKFAPIVAANSVSVARQVNKQLSLRMCANLEKIELHTRLERLFFFALFVVVVVFFSLLLVLCFLLFYVILCYFICREIEK